MAPRACKFHCWYKAPQNTLSIKHLNMIYYINIFYHYFSKIYLTSFISTDTLKRVLRKGEISTTL